MIDISHKRAWTRWHYVIVASAFVVLLPLAFFAGWLADLSQIRPVLTQLGRVQQKTPAKPLSVSQEPPGASPQIHVSWGKSKVLLTWSRVPGASKYTVYRAEGDLGFAQAKIIGQVSQSVRQIEFADLSVTPGHPYTYWVAAANGAGMGPPSTGVSGRTFLSSAVIARSAEQAAVQIQAHLWSQGGMGLFSPVDHVKKAMAFRIGHVLYTSLYLPPSAVHSNWLVRRWSTWTQSHTRLEHVKSLDRLAVLRNPGMSSKAPSLQLGSLSRNNVVVWRHNGHWQYQSFAGTMTEGLPAGAIVLNGYSQVCGMTNASGKFVALSSSSN